jgi:hypothetical protein
MLVGLMILAAGITSAQAEAYATKTKDRLSSMSV